MFCIRTYVRTCAHASNTFRACVHEKTLLWHHWVMEYVRTYIRTRTYVLFHTNLTKNVENGSYVRT